MGELEYRNLNGIMQYNTDNKEYFEMAEARTKFVRRK